MFPGRFFPWRFFPVRFFPKVGATPPPTPPAGGTPHMLYENGRFDPTNQPVMRQVVVSVTSAQLKNLVAAPVLILPAPGANKIIAVHKAVVYLQYNSVAYINPSGVAALYYGTSVVGFQVYGIANALWAQTTDFLSGPDQANISTLGTTVPSAVINTAISLVKTNSDLTTGNSPVKIALTYYIIDLS